MSTGNRCLAMIPARGGSKSLPGKNIRPFAGLPLIAHTILFAKMCPEIDLCIVSTDSDDIAEVAVKHGANVPFLRPAELAQDGTPMWPVVRHALNAVEQSTNTSFDSFLLLDPTSPARQPSDISDAFSRLNENPDSDGVIGVSKPEFNPIWTCVIERDGWMTGLLGDEQEFGSRQEVPPVYRINGSMYLWRTNFIRTHEDSWRAEGKYLMHEIPELRAMSIDDADQFQRAELLVNEGLIKLPWLQKNSS